MDALARLVAIEDIKQLKARYWRAVDTKDDALFRSVFCDDCVFDFSGMLHESNKKVEEMVGGVTEIMRGADHSCAVLMKTIKDLNATSVHQGGVPEIEITSDTTATGIWPMWDRIQLYPGQPYRELIGYGHYHETYEVQGGRWKIKYTKLTRLRMDYIE
jgi:hypothetical protein